MAPVNLRKMNSRQNRKVAVVAESSKNKIKQPSN